MTSDYIIWGLGRRTGWNLQEGWLCAAAVTYGENVVSVCQDNTGTNETIENNVNL